MTVDPAGDGRWQLESSNSYLEIESWSFIQHENYHLHVMQKVNIESSRERMPGTKAERLSYFRTYGSLLCRTHFLCHNKLTRLLWYYVFTLLCKSLPSSYVYMFLSSYASEEHLFLSKMVPISYGCNIAIIFSAFFELSTAADILTRLSDYVVQGFIYKNPWNRCSRNNSSHTVRHCQTLEEFSEMVKTVNMTAKSSTFELQDGTEILIAPMSFLIERSKRLHGMVKFNSPVFVIGWMSFWIIAALNDRQLYKRNIWVIMDKIQWVSNFVLLSVMAHLLWVKLENEMPGLIVQRSDMTIIHNQAYGINNYFVAESVTSPPVVHVLTARSNDPISPGRDSLIMVMSNAINFVSRAFLAHIVTEYCESQLRAPIQIGTLNQYPWFIIFPTYFSLLPIGEFLTLIFFLTLFLTELTAFIITYQCLVEVVACEWPKIRRWMVSVALTAAALVNVVLIRDLERTLIYVVTKQLVTLFEILVVIYMYPLGRLIEDFKFHYGNPPSKIRIWSLRSMPIYYLIKLYYTMNGYLTLFSSTKLAKLLTTFKCAAYVTVATVVLGSVYVITKLLCYERQNWRVLFRPTPKWGPLEHILRQLRKQYRSNEYIQSLSSRYLSRYLMSKAEADTYKLDIAYERGGRRQSTNIKDDIRYDNEKKFA